MIRYTLSKQDIDSFIISEVQSHIKNSVTIQKQLLSEKIYGIDKGVTQLPSKPWSDTKTESILRDTFKLLKLKPSSDADVNEIKSNEAVYVALTENDTIYFYDDQTAESYARNEKYGYTVDATGIRLYNTETPSEFNVEKNNAGFLKFIRVSKVPGTTYVTGEFTLSSGEQEKAKKQVKTKKQKAHDTWDEVAEWSSIIAHGALDVAGFFDFYGVGTAADLVNSLLYVYEEQYFYAALSMIASIPGAGSVIAMPIKYLFKSAKGVMKAVKTMAEGIVAVLKYLVEFFKGNAMAQKAITSGWKLLEDLYKASKGVLQQKFTPSVLQPLWKQIDEGLKAGRIYLDDLYKAGKGKFASTTGKIGSGADDLADAINPNVVPNRTKLFSSSKFNHYYRRWTSLTFDESTKQTALALPKILNKIPVGRQIKTAGDFIINAFTVSIPKKQMAVIMNTMKRTFIEAYSKSPEFIKTLNVVAKRKLIPDTVTELTPLLKNSLDAVIKEKSGTLLDYAKNVLAPIAQQGGKLTKQQLQQAAHLKQFSGITKINGKLTSSMSHNEFWFNLINSEADDLVVMVNGVESALSKEALLKNPQVAEHLLMNSKSGARYVEEWVGKQVEDMNPIYANYISDPLNALNAKVFRTAEDATNGLRTLIMNQLTDARRYARYVVAELSAGVQIATGTGISGEPEERGLAKTKIPSYLGGDIVEWFENDPKAQNTIIASLFGKIGADSQKMIKDTQKDLEKAGELITGPETGTVYTTPN